MKWKLTLEWYDKNGKRHKAGVALEPRGTKYSKLRELWQGLESLYKHIERHSELYGNL